MSKPYILAVDDDPDVLGTLYRALTREGFEVGRATSGLEALKMLAARRPELIILDIIMPGLDGLTVCRRVRGRQAVRRSGYPVPDGAQSTPTTLWTGWTLAATTTW